MIDILRRRFSAPRVRDSVSVRSYEGPRKIASLLVDIDMHGKTGPGVRSRAVEFNDVIFRRFPRFNKKSRGTSDSKNIFNLALLDRKILVKHLIDSFGAHQYATTPSDRDDLRIARQDIVQACYQRSELSTTIAVYLAFRKSPVVAVVT